MVVQQQRQISDTTNFRWTLTTQIYGCSPTKTDIRHYKLQVDPYNTDLWLFSNKVRYQTLQTLGGHLQHRSMVVQQQSQISDTTNFRWTLTTQIYGCSPTKSDIRHYKHQVDTYNTDLWLFNNKVRYQTLQTLGGHLQHRSMVVQQRLISDTTNIRWTLTTQIYGCSTKTDIRHYKLQVDTYNRDLWLFSNKDRYQTLQTLGGHLQHRYMVVQQILISDTTNFRWTLTTQIYGCSTTKTDIRHYKHQVDTYNTDIWLFNKDRYQTLQTLGGHLQHRYMVVQQQRQISDTTNIRWTLTTQIYGCSTKTDIRHYKLQVDTYNRDLWLFSNKDRYQTLQTLGGHLQHRYMVVQQRLISDTTNFRWTLTTQIYGCSTTKTDIRHYKHQVDTDIWLINKDRYQTLQTLGGHLQHRYMVVQQQRQISDTTNIRWTLTTQIYGCSTKTDIRHYKLQVDTYNTDIWLFSNKD